jgi:hypothetical protein
MRILIPFFDPVFQQALVGISNADQFLLPVPKLLLVFLVDNDPNRRGYQQATPDDGIQESAWQVREAA